VCGLQSEHEDNSSELPVPGGSFYQSLTPVTTWLRYTRRSHLPVVSNKQSSEMIYLWWARHLLGVRTDRSGIDVVTLVRRTYIRDVVSHLLLLVGFFDNIYDKLERRVSCRSSNEVREFHQYRFQSSPVAPFSSCIYRVNSIRYSKV